MPGPRRAEMNIGLLIFAIIVSLILFSGSLKILEAVIVEWKKSKTLEPIPLVAAILIILIAILLLRTAMIM